MSVRVKIFHRILILLSFLSIVSCYAHDHYVTYYFRSERKNTYFEKSYTKQIDTINLSKISLCKRGSIVTGRLRTKGKLIIEKNQIQENIINRLQNDFNYVNSTLEKSLKWDYICQKQDKKEVLYKSNKHNFKNAIDYNIEVYLKIEYKSSRDSVVNNVYGFWIELLDNDKHIINYTLYLTIFHNNKPIYMDNSGHTVILETKLNENINYEVPQNIIDSLVTKSLAEYKKRLKT